MGCCESSPGCEAPDAVEVSEPPSDEEADRETDWVRLGGAELEQPLREEWIKLIRADWLIAHAARGGTLARRQDMPPDAYVDVDELMQAGAGGSHGGGARVEWLRVLVLSYPWLQPGHPDPHGENLRLLVQFLQLYVDSESAGEPYGVLIDFPALFQAPRSEEEQEVFLRALPALNVFYSHPATVVLKITQFPEGYPHNPSFLYVLPEGANTVDYAERGWCFAESSMSGLVKPSSLVLTLRHDYDFRWQSGMSEYFFQKALAQVIAECQAGRAPPLHPAEFREELSKKTFTSRKADFDKVNKLYSDAFERRLARAAELDFSRLGWGVREVQQLNRALRDNCASLQSLDLSENGLEGDQGAAELVGALEGSAALFTLMVAKCGIGNAGAVALAQVLEGTCSLQTLQLRDNGIQEEGAVALGRALESNRSLQALHLPGNSVRGEGLAALGEGLEKNGALRTLDLGSIGCRARGALILGKALESNRSLQTLDLRRNGIGEEGAVALAKALEKNDALRMLVLYENGAGDPGAVALGRTLERNHSLRTLDLRHNEIGTEGVIALGRALEKNRTLQELNLYWNNCGDPGAVALGRALESNRSLQTLDLRRNEIGEEGTTALKALIEKSHGLQTLSL